MLFRESVQLKSSCSLSSSYWRTAVLEHHGKCSQRSGPTPGQHLHLLVTRGLSLITNDGAGLQQRLVGGRRDLRGDFNFSCRNFYFTVFQSEVIMIFSSHPLPLSVQWQQSVLLMHYCIVSARAPSFSLASSPNALLLFLIRKLLFKLNYSFSDFLELP